MLISRGNQTCSLLKPNPYALLCTEYVLCHMVASQTLPGSLFQKAPKIGDNKTPHKSSLG